MDFRLQVETLFVSSKEYAHRFLSKRALSVRVQTRWLGRILQGAAPSRPGPAAMLLQCSRLSHSVAASC